MAPSSIEDYMTEAEEIKLRWEGGLTSGSGDATDKTLAERLEDAQNQATTTKFAATTQRLLYLDGDASFKDIDYKHISSVEVDKSTEPDPTPLQTLTLISGIGFVAVTGMALVMGEPVWLLLSLVSIAGLGYAYSKGISLDELGDLNEITTYDITVITGDEAHQQISFETEENVGADLSRIVREHS